MSWWLKAYPGRPVSTSSNINFYVTFCGIFVEISLQKIETEDAQLLYIPELFLRPVRNVWNASSILVTFLTNREHFLFTSSRDIEALSINIPKIFPQKRKVKVNLIYEHLWEFCITHAPLFSTSYTITEFDSVSFLKQIKSGGISLTSWVPILFNHQSLANHINQVLSHCPLLQFM